VKRTGAAAVLLSSYLIGSVPFANLAARRLQGVDLRSHGNGTVSGTGLYEVAGFGPLAVVGCLELAKGAAGPLAAGARRPALAAAAAGAAVAGHNWSPFLGFAGGRGLAPALGASLVVAPEGAALLAAGLAGGRLAGETAVGCLVAMAAMPFVLGRRRGRRGLEAAAALLVPMVAKRLCGNAPVPPGHRDVYFYRLVLDRDTAF
jgi:glycerol-3-phosphate acyltransferase PlsY